jgi:hypothetical protein
MVLAGLWLYLRVTEGTTMLARYGMMVFVAFMLLLNVFNLFLPPSDSNRNLTMLAVLALAVYFLLAAMPSGLIASATYGPACTCGQKDRFHDIIRHQKGPLAKVTGLRQGF